MRWGEWLDGLGWGAQKLTFLLRQEDFLSLVCSEIKDCSLCDPVSKPHLSARVRYSEICLMRHEIKLLILQ